MSQIEDNEKENAEVHGDRWKINIKRYRLPNVVHKLPLVTGHKIKGSKGSLPSSSAGSDESLFSLRAHTNTREYLPSCLNSLLRKIENISISRESEL